MRQTYHGPDADAPHPTPPSPFAPPFYASADAPAFEPAPPDDGDGRYAHAQHYGDALGTPRSDAQWYSGTAGFGW